MRRAMWSIAAVSWRLGKRVRQHHRRYAFNSQHLDNSGSIAANQLALNQTRITNSGHLLSAGEAQIQANTLHNSGQISGAD